MDSSDSSLVRHLLTSAGLSVPLPHSVWHDTSARDCVADVLC